MLPHVAGGVEARALRDADERVPDGAQLVVHARAPAALLVPALEGTAGHGAGAAPIAAAAVPDHLYVLGVGEGLAEVPIQVGAVARDDEDLTRHLLETLVPLQIVGQPSGPAPGARGPPAKGGPRAPPGLGAVALPPAQRQ